jgi:transposase
MATEIRYGEIAMMGEQTGLQPKIFYPQMNLQQRVPRTHLLRRIQGQMDFNFIYAEVRETYGSNGNVSIPPPVKLKMILLLILYNVRSEREFKHQETKSLFFLRTGARR